jgi:hypothetical protein
MAHQPGYLEAKACRILAHAKYYIEEDQDESGLSGNALRAWAILTNAYMEADQVRQATIRRIQGKGGDNAKI